MSNPIYEHGIDTILDRWNARRTPLNGANAGLPELDCDLDIMVRTPVTEIPPKGRRFSGKARDLAKELHGKSELCLLHGLIIATLRKEKWPKRAPALFQRVWTEHGDHLLANLDARWKVSAITTFGDHGLTETQRRLGQSLSVLFGIMKLYESERRYSGLASDQPFPAARPTRSRLPLQMDAYSMKNGGLDVNLIAPLWVQAQEDAVIGPLARDLLQRLITDPRSVFARHALMRKRQTEAGGDR